MLKNLSLHVALAACLAVSVAGSAQAQGKTSRGRSADRQQQLEKTERSRRDVAPPRVEKSDRARRESNEVLIKQSSGTHSVRLSKIHGR